ncbi:MAG: saccharopine dehydrogenase family protein [Gemmatimonadaceae bacterium]
MWSCAWNGQHPRAVRHRSARSHRSRTDLCWWLAAGAAPPINYQVVYSLEGMLDYYTTPSWVLRDGRRAQVAALGEIERVDFPEPLGELEAFHTAGGLSTMAFRYEGEIPTMEYKTLRYPGHAAIMAAIRDLGLLDVEEISVNGTRGAPRDVALAVLRDRLTNPEGKDVVALRVVVSGAKGGRPAQHTFALVDRYDEQRGISAMMRTRDIRSRSQG